MKLPKQEKQNWLKALRSGDYKQGKGMLKDEYSLNVGVEYCCIGVYGECNNIPITKDGLRFVGDNLEGFIYETMEKLIGQDQTSTLIAMNDYGDKTFLEIADYIETNL